MLFAIIGRDGPEGQEKRKLYRDEHIDRLEKLAREGKVILAGPFGDQSGSLIVFEADSLQEAKAFASGDPYVTKGVFESHEVRPFKQVFPR